MRKIRRMMMPPPPPASAFSGETPAGESENHVYLQSGAALIMNEFDRSTARQKLMMVSQELRSSIALTEMRQERFRLMRDSAGFVSPSLSQNHSASYKRILDDIFAVLDIVESIASSASKKQVRPEKKSPLIASLGGLRFHNPDCIVVERIPKEKRLSFLDRAEAESAGYKPCTICSSSAGSLVGSREHSKVHRESCISVRNISMDNAVSFSSEKEAFDLGFSPCKLCMHN